MKRLKVEEVKEKMREYARIDFEIPEDEIEEVVKEAMECCVNIQNDEIVHEAVNLVLRWTGSEYKLIKTKVKSFDELKLEEEIAKRRCLIKQAQDRKTRTVSNSEKQYLERWIRSHRSVIRDCEEKVLKDFSKNA